MFIETLLFPPKISSGEMLVAFLNCKKMCQNMTIIPAILHICNLITDRNCKTASMLNGLIKRTWAFLHICKSILKIITNCMYWFSLPIRLAIVI